MNLLNDSRIRGLIEKCDTIGCPLPSTRNQKTHTGRYVREQR